MLQAEKCWVSQDEFQQLLAGLPLRRADPNHEYLNSPLIPAITALESTGQIIVCKQSVYKVNECTGWSALRMMLFATEKGFPLLMRYRRGVIDATILRTVVLAAGGDGVTQEQKDLVVLSKETHRLNDRIDGLVRDLTVAGTRYSELNASWQGRLDQAAATWQTSINNVTALNKQQVETINAANAEITGLKAHAVTREETVVTQTLIIAELQQERNDLEKKFNLTQAANEQQHRVLQSQEKDIAALQFELAELKRNGDGS